VCRFVIVISYVTTYETVPVAAQSKMQVCDRLPAETVGSNSTGAGVFVVNVECCQVEVSASGW